MPNGTAPAFALLAFVAALYMSIAMVRAGQARGARRVQIESMRASVHGDPTALDVPRFAAAWRAFSSQCPPGREMEFLERELGPSLAGSRDAFVRVVHAFLARVEENPRAYLEHESGARFDEHFDAVHGVVRAGHALFGRDPAWTDALVACLETARDPVAHRAAARKIEPWFSDDLLARVQSCAHTHAQRDPAGFAVWCGEAAALALDAFDLSPAPARRARLEELIADTDLAYAHADASMRDELDEARAALREALNRKAAAHVSA